MNRVSICAGLVSGLSVSGTPALVQTVLEMDQRRSDIIVAAIREDDRCAPAEATLAGKSPTPLIEIPQSVNIVTRKQTEDRNLFTIGDAIQTVAGVTVMPFDGSNPVYRARLRARHTYDGPDSRRQPG
ncbi:TonB-dependent receptor plug domain-containing protein [Sphingomonas sp. CJ20]